MLRNLSTEVLVALLKVLEQKYPEHSGKVNNPSELATEEQRMKLAWRAGQRSVVDEIAVVINRKVEKAKNGSLIQSTGPTGPADADGSDEHV